MKTLNADILELIKEYPIDGTHGYHWVNGFDGATRDIHYQGRLILKGNEKKQTYCCGLTLEHYLRLAIKHNIDLGGFQDVIQIKREWFCATGKYKKNTDYKGPVDALVHRGLAIEVPFMDALPGDFAQIWRKRGSGHSIEIIDPKIPNGLEYFSTQPSTDGIGFRKEYFGGDHIKNPITHIYIARAIIPEVKEEVKQTIEKL